MINLFLPDLSVVTKCFLAFGLSLAVSLLAGGKLINLLRIKQGKGQPIREDGPQSHLSKKGTPTMGGILILGTTLFSTIIFAGLTNPFILTCIAVIIVYGFVGFVDDYEKVTKQNSDAMSAKMKLVLQFSTALFATIIICFFTPEESRFQLNLPYFQDLALKLWWFYIPFAMVVITGSSNAVNLNDGLDGLSASLLIFAFFFFMIAACLSPLPYAFELAILCAAVIGSCLGFLWFNANPAKVFMGDVGSLSLGALLGTISVMLKSEILLAIVGFVFVAEALSVMIQVFWFKKTGKRIFKMAPIHHHFEQIGWPETRVVARFRIIAFALTILGLFAII